MGMIFTGFFYVTREMDLLLMPRWADFDLNLIQWPPFLLASKVSYLLNDFLFMNTKNMLTFQPFDLQLPIALDMAKDSKGKDRDRERELQKRLNADGYMLCAVQECYATCQNILYHLVLGEYEKEYVNHHLSLFIVDLSYVLSQLVKRIKSKELAKKETGQMGQT